MRLFTIGYEGRSFAEILHTLQEAGIGRLADIRARPLSRRAGFSKTLLGASLEAGGIAYLHCRPLGTPAEGRARAKAGDVAGMQAIFTNHLATPEAQAGLAALKTLIQTETAPLCLLCFEAKPAICHRRLVSEALRQQLPALQVTDL